MNNHQIVIYEAKGVLKTALKVGMGIKLGLELGDFIYYVALGAKECCKKYGLDYEDDNSEDS